jgi:phosphoadenosine phosphosulfate reductase
MAEALRLVDPLPESQQAEARPSAIIDVNLDQLVELEADQARLNAELEARSPEDVVAWAGAAFGESVILSSSFGAESALMLHLVTRVLPKVRVVFLDTGYLFPDTYRFAEQLRERFDLDLRVYAPAISTARQEALWGQLWNGGQEELERYQLINKVEPMQRALRELGARAWLAGLRREQTKFRAGLKPLELQDGVFKVHPILNFTREDVRQYMAKHELPYHPLHALGYRSIGDVHSTRATREGENERDGRNLGVHSECGIHLPRTPEENASLKASSL